MWPLHGLWGQTVDNFCSHMSANYFNKVSSKFNEACRRRSIFHKNDLFDLCDPYMTFEVKLLIIFVATHLLVILTKFGRNRIKHVEEEANCEKERKKERKKEERRRTKSQERNKLGGIPPNLNIQTCQSRLYPRFSFYC